ncbi:MAG: relaxase/mobilization nuclease domain-containing protein [Alphaproteobacteria bacterium]|nr:relaxase/mobilization nuclease domain-containing protein [Alphaproteobacteria bacterium]
MPPDHLSKSGESLPEDALHDIEQRFSACLGFEEHQRVVDAHKNTENFHLHVAYNMIHPATLNIHHPRWDYYARDRVCQAMKLKYDLAADYGHDKWREWRDDRE